MRRSNKVILSAIFMTAVTTAKVTAQEQQDSTSQHRSHHHSFNWFGLRRTRSARQGNSARPETVSAPRTNGFGNTLRSTSSAHS